MSDRKKNNRYVVVALCIAALFHSSRYLPHFSDDGFIALRYADRLASGHGLSWSEGVWVEGYSDLLWVLCIAALQLGGVDGVQAARFLGSIGLVLGVAALCRVSWPNAGWLVLSGALCSWTVGGLEHALVGGIAAWAALLLREERGTALAPLLAWLRVDGIVLVLGLGLANGRKGWRFVGAGLLAVLLQLIVRLYLYADWLPNTARAKVGFTPGRLVQGLRYVIEGAVWHAPLLVLAVAATVVLRRSTPALTACLVWLVYVVLIGGDHFNGFRMWVPIVPLLALAVASAPLPRWAVPAGLLAFLPQLMSDPIVSQTQPGWALQTLAPARALKRGFGEQVPLLATDAAGALPYGTGFPTIDMLGLNDSFLALNRPDDFGTGPLHHELGDGRYVASRRPDLLAFCSGLGAFEPCFRSGKELIELPDFSAYRAVVIEEDGVLGRYWLRADGGFGPLNEGHGLEVPALLLSSIEVPARAGHDGFYLDLPKGSPVSIELELPPGRWRVATQGFRGPMVLHGGGKIRLRATTITDRVSSSVTWVRE